MKPLTMGSLFAGIGGFDLGFERAGFKTVWQVEINEYCRKVLARHFPDAERYADIRECGVHNLKPVDVICGGFPCQDISNAGLRAGINGERSGLWREMHRIISELRPRYVVVENVAALLFPIRRDGWIEPAPISRVVGDLATIGYDADWDVISAADVGAPHLRERIWVVAYPNSEFASANGADRFVDGQARQDQGDGHQRQWPGYTADDRCKDVADTSRVQSGRAKQWTEWQRAWQGGESGDEVADSYVHASIRTAITRRECRNWEPEPNVGRVAHGVPARVDRLRALGNAVVPQIPELIARRLKLALSSD